MRHVPQTRTPTPARTRSPGDPTCQTAPVGNVTLPTPVLIAAAALFLLAGYLIGVVAGPDTPDRTIGVVESYNPSTRELCLTGEAVEDHERAEDGMLCGVWQRAGNSATPRVGDDFRFVIDIAEHREGDEDDRIFIFGEVDDD